MYDQMFSDINRHILVVWQSVGVLIGGFAIFALAEKQVVSIDIASSLIVLIASWLIAHLIDAGYWYNRNLVIIANIERQFLRKKDLHDIHYYFGKHRPDNKMLTHLRIQFALGVGILGIVLLFHFATRVIPGFGSPLSSFEFERALPYAVIIIAVLYLLKLKRNRDSSYNEFVEYSPGKEVDSSEIRYGVGHGFSEKQKEDS